MKKPSFPRSLLFLSIAAITSSSFASDYHVWLPRNEALSHHEYILKNGQYSWYYNRTNDPKTFSIASERIIMWAMSDWARVCNVKFTYLGETTQWFDRDGVNTVSWFVDNPTIGGGAGTWISRGRITEADFGFNPTYIRNDYQLYQVALHEVGHILGIAHIATKGAVMSGPPYTEYAFPGQLTDEDIISCQHMYGPPKVER